MEQSSLGGNRQIYRQPVYNQTQIGYVTSAKDYKQYGRVEVVFLDYSNPFPVWAVGMDREPMDGDQVVVGFMQGRVDAPYLVGFVRNESYTSNYVIIEKDKITLQVPTDIEDNKGHLLDDSKSNTRIILEVATDMITAKFKDTLTLKITSSEVTINDSVVACIGNAVSVEVPTIGTCTGTITGV